MVTAFTESLRTRDATFLEARDNFSHKESISHTRHPGRPFWAEGEFGNPADAMIFPPLSTATARAFVAPQSNTITTSLFIKILVCL